MGLFKREEKVNTEKRYRKIHSGLEILGKEDKQFVEMMNRLQMYYEKPGYSTIRPFSMVLDVVEAILNNSGDYSSKYMSALEYAESIYTCIFPYDENTPDFEMLANVYLELFAPGGVASKRCFDGTFFLLFHNPDNYIRWYQSQEPDTKYFHIWKHYVSYGVLARGLFPDEDMFTANMVYVTRRMNREPEPKTVYDEEIRNVYHMAGIYNVDESMILRAEQQIQASREVLEHSTDVVERVTEQIDTITTLSDTAVDRVKSVCEQEVKVIQSKIDTMKERFAKEEERIRNEQKQVVLLERDQLVESIVADSAARLQELAQSAQAMLSTTKLELARLNRESQGTLTKLDGYLQNHGELKEILADAAMESELRSKIDRLSVLNEATVAAIAEQAAAAQAAPSKPTANAVPTPTGGTSISISNNERTVVSGQDVPEEYTDPVELPRVNPFFDETIPFKSRFQAVMKQKEKLMEDGEHFHKMFDDVLIAVMENANPYLIGPSGCGKTYMVGQLARLLGAEFVDIGYINEEYDILGFQTANGGYSKPNFYRCYKYGKIAFCDELDNGNSRATVKLNSFLSNVKDAGYNFPNGEHVQRHANFRVIGAGNTAGNGADANYNTREKIEESVQQRFTPIYVDYDNSVEEAILGQYKDWYDLVVRFRAATTAWSVSNRMSAAGIITTRDVTRICRYLDNESFSAEKILDYEFVQTKDEDYLAFLSRHMTKGLTEDAPGAALVKMFVEKVEEIRKGHVLRG